MNNLREHKSITEEEKILLIKCRDAIKSMDSSAQIILYGSRARGDAEPESDYDLLILTGGDVSLEREDQFRRQLFPLELETGCVLTVILYSKREWNTSLYQAMPFSQNVERDGVIL